jgi:predicted RecB family nuclease
MTHSDLHLLPGLRRETIATLYRMGITTMAQIAALHPDELRRIKGIKTSAEAIHASACAWQTGVPVWLNALPPICHGGGWMFDIETDPRTGTMWSLGWSDERGEVQVALAAPQVRRASRLTLADGSVIHLVPDDIAIWETFAEAVSADDRPIYHWTGFDTSVMRKTAPDMVNDRLQPRAHDLHATYKRCLRFPVSNASLKTVAAFLNFSWSAYAAWDAAFNDYNLWLSRDDLPALTRACSYQKDDVRAMQVIWDWMVRHAVR